MKFRYGAIACGLTLVLTACGTFPPQRQDPFEGILAKPPAAAAQSTIPDARNKSLGLIVSAGTEANLRYSQEVMTKAAGTFMETAVKAGDPKYVADQIVAVLRRHFKDVRIIQDLNEFRASNLDLAGVLDIHYESSGGYTGSETVVNEVQVHFLNRGIERIAVADSRVLEKYHQAATCGVGAPKECYAKLFVDTALKGLKDSADELEKAVAKITVN